MGTWCGDSKKWVPMFVRLWDDLGLKREQLSFVGLYDFTDGKYKQGPNGEEKGLGIHRVPTFILKRNKKEIGRIVEYPVVDLQTDLEKIAMGDPSPPNYPAATYLINLFESNPAIPDEEEEKISKKLSELTENPKELNTLGYVFLDANKIKKALKVFHFNCKLFDKEPSAYINYGYVLAQQGKIEKAMLNYQKALTLDKDNAFAKNQIELLKNKL